MGPTGPNQRVLQVHPSRRCNLRCLHCYSRSGPEEREALAFPLLESAIAAAATAGFNVLAVSGGEPLLYPELRPLLECGRRYSMATAVTTNGMLLDERRLALLQGAVDVLAISLDGVPASHVRMRNAPDAFSRMASRLPALRSLGIPFGFIFTLTQFNLHELDWVAEFAVDQGARLLQIHPLEEVGRAVEMLPETRPDDVEAGFAYIEMRRLRERFGDRLTFQLDFAPKRLIQAEPARVFADDREASDGWRLADLVSPLVIEPDGTIVPLEYGFDRRYALGNLHEASLETLDRAWRHTRAADFRALCRRVFEQAVAPEGPPLFNWYEDVAHCAAG